MGLPYQTKGPRQIALIQPLRLGPIQGMVQNQYGPNANVAKGQYPHAAGTVRTPRQVFEQLLCLLGEEFQVVPGGL